MFISRDGKRVHYESELVEEFIEYASNQQLLFKDFHGYNIYQEVRVPEIKRRSDIVLYTSNNKVINIEFKLHDLKTVLAQAKDHKKWADYSLICMPANAFSCETPKWIQRFIEEGIGILLFAGGTFVEIIKPYYNTYKSGKSKRTRTNVLSRLKNSQMKLSVENKHGSEIPTEPIPVMQGNNVVGKAILRIEKAGLKAKIVFNKTWKTKDREFKLVLGLEAGTDIKAKPIIKDLNIKFRYTF